MAVTTILKEIKTLYPECILLVRRKGFYRAYGRDTYILSYLFKYKIIKTEQISTVGFPIENVDKVKNKLKYLKIDYMILDRKNGYDREELVENKEYNKYKEMYKKSKDYIDSKIRIDKIYKKLLKNLNNKKLIQDIEKILGHS